jgi:hypothetical protein
LTTFQSGDFGERYAHWNYVEKASTDFRSPRLEIQRRNSVVKRASGF